MKIELLHRNNLRISSSCSSSFNSKSRTLRRLAQAAENLKLYMYIYFLFACLLAWLDDLMRPVGLTFFLRWAPIAWLMPIVVVVFPSPRGVGVTPVITTYYFFDFLIDFLIFFQGSVLSPFFLGGYCKPFRSFDPLASP